MAKLGIPDAGPVPCNHFLPRSRCSKGKVIRAGIVEHYPPDTTACIFWLKNRQPQRWRDRVEVQHQDGRIGVIGRIPTDE